MLLLPVVIVVCLAEFTEGGMDSKVLAMLGVLTAINAVMRGLGAGMAGIELVFFLLILGGRVFGAGLRVRAGLHVAVRLGAADRRRRAVAAVPDARLGVGRDGCRAAAAAGHAAGREIAMLVVYGIVAAYAFGLLMNMSSWPFTLGIEVPGHTGGLSFVPGAPMLENLHRFGVYTLLTSTGSWDTGRAITNTVALVVLGPAVLTTLRRAVRRATVHQGLILRGGRAGSGRRSAAGSPRPSRLEVVTHRLPSGAATTVRIRPYVPTKKPFSALAFVPFTSTRQSRSPFRAPSHSRPSRKASPEGEASSVDHVTCGFVQPGSSPLPSTSGQP